jgi:hypothetical protein
VWVGAGEEGEAGVSDLLAGQVRAVANGFAAVETRRGFVLQDPGTGRPGR